MYDSVRCRQHIEAEKGACIPHLRGAGDAEMPKKEGERAARDPRRYRLEPEVGASPRFLMPELDLASPPRPAASKGPGL